MLEEDESKIRRFYEIASSFAPDYDMEKIMRKLEAGIASKS